MVVISKNLLVDRDFFYPSIVNLSRICRFMRMNIVMKFNLIRISLF